MLIGMAIPIPNPGWLDDFIKLYLAQFPQNQPNDGTPDGPKKKRIYTIA